MHSAKKRKLGMAPDLVHRPKSANVTATSNFGEWCAMTGWHGILDFYSSKSLFLKITWLIVIVGGILFTGDQCVSLILDFTTDDKWMTSVTFEMPKDGGALEWPNISVCNLNLQTPPKANGSAEEIYADYITAYARFADVDSLWFYDQTQAAEPKFLNQSDQDIIEAIKIIRNASNEYLGSASMTELVKNNTGNCNVTAIHCGRSAEFDLRKRPAGCCNQDTAVVNCFSIFSDDAFPKSFQNTGHDSAAYILFNPRTNDYYRKLFKFESPSAGLKLSLYYGEKDAAVTTEILVAPGTHVMVSLVKEIHRATDRRSRAIQFYKFKKPCVARHEHSYEYMNYGVYSKPLCERDCLAKWSASQCKCIIQGTSFDSNKSVPCVGGTEIFRCNQIISSISISKEMENSNDTNDPTNQLKACYARCTEACDYETIDTKVSTAMYPASVKLPAFTTYLNRALGRDSLNFTEEETRQLIFFEMYYEMKEYRVIEKVSKTSVDELISNLGGALGVWTGLSMLSIYQCLVYAFKGVFARRNRVIRIRL